MVWVCLGRGFVVEWVCLGRICRGLGLSWEDLSCGNFLGGICRGIGLSGKDWSWVGIVLGGFVVGWVCRGEGLSGESVVGV